MRPGRQFLVGIVLALLSGGLALGSLSLALAESGYVLVGAQAVPGVQITFSGEMVLLLARDATATAAAASVTAGRVASTTPTPRPNCIPPAGWQVIAVPPDQTLRGLARAYEITEEQLKAANCMIASSLAPGSLLYVPASSGRASPSPTICRPPSTWIVYNVRPGDTWAHLASAVGQSIRSLQQANCLTSGFLYSGQAVYLPFYPPVLTYPSVTPWIWASPTPPLAPGTIIPPATSVTPPTATLEPATVVPTTVEPTIAIPTATELPTTVVPTMPPATSTELPPTQPPTMPPATSTELPPTQPPTMPPTQPPATLPATELPTLPPLTSMPPTNAFPLMTLPGVSAHP